MVSQLDEAPRRARRETKPLDVPQTLVGRVLNGRYRLERVLNSGGMGIIFVATQLGIERQVALKVLKPTLSGDPALIKRFSLEVELVASLSHPNIVTLIDSAQDPTGLTYLVMELIDGMTFREALKYTQLTLAEIVDVLAQTSNALIETHARGIIHRDLKFDNIMLIRMRDGRLHVKLLDFGVAKLLSGDANLTKGGQVAGTPGIIAPELVDGERPTPKSDLYSMGVLLFTALTGHAPFKADNDLELMRAHRQLSLPNLAEIVGNSVPEELIELTNELLAKNPKQRPVDALQVRNRLEVIKQVIQQNSPDPVPYQPTAGAQHTFEDQNPPYDTDVDLLNAHKNHDDNTTDQGWIRRLIKEPIIAPITVVMALSLVLMILVLIIIYSLYTIFIMKQPI